MPLCRLMVAVVAAIPAFAVLGCARPEGATKDSQRAASASPEEAEFNNSIGMKLKLIPAGKFTMGFAAARPGQRDLDEDPEHEVEITRPFYMGAYEVTQEEYQKVMDTNPSGFSPSGKNKDRVSGLDTARFPVECVSWDEAVAFCRKLSQRPEESQARRVYRLPTEAEWEYACRAKTTTAYHSGDALSALEANCDGNFPHGGAEKGPFLRRTTAVGSYKPNAYGLYDMHGNVWEWCADWTGPSYYKASPAKDPPGPPAGDSRIVRGGCWENPAVHCRSALRSCHPPHKAAALNGFGFRVVCTVSARD